MSDADEGRLLLDRITVQGSAVSICWEMLLDESITPQLLADRVTAGEAVIAEAELLPFLRESGLVMEKEGTLRCTAVSLPGERPQLLLLRLLHQRSDANLLFRLVWEALLEVEDWVGIQLHRDVAWPVLQERLAPTGGIPRLNANRMAQWQRIAAFIGLIQPERSNHFFLLPTEALWMALLRVTLPPDKPIALADWITAVEGEYCRITVRPGVIHPGIAAVLQLLEQDEQVVFTYVSDERPVHLGKRLASQIRLGRVVSAGVH